ncbi:unnamed protein product [Rhizophagus irregularis]|uniref:Uncharacterized protein n=1 Tax=Rhizophagus irregularis TaxID=588596 RepID=A0A915ZBP2_9GLOM|nr:unnamed protein product [Rhizophagus irregularis]
MFYQKTARRVGQRADQVEFMRGQAKAVAIIDRLRLWVDHEDLRRGLFDDRTGNLARQRVGRALGAEADDAVAFSDRLFPILDAQHERGIVERFPAFIDHDDAGRAIQPLFDAVEQIHHHRRARGGIVEDLRHVEAERRHVEIERVFFIVEQPRIIALAAPRRQARGQIERGRASASTEQLDEIAQPPERARLAEIGVDRIGDARQVLRVERGASARYELRHPVAQKAPVGGLVLQQQRVEPGRLAGTQQIIAPANRAQEDLRAAILVEIDGAR